MSSAHNDPVENLIGAAIVGGPLTAYGGMLVAPYISSAAQAVAITVLSNPATVATVQKQASEFAQGFFQPGPPDPVPYGYAGSAARWAFDKWKW